MFRYFLILVLFLTWTYGAPRAYKKHSSIRSKDSILKREQTSDVIKSCLSKDECHPDASCRLGICVCESEFRGNGINCTSSCPKCHPKGRCNFETSQCECRRSHGDGIEICEPNCPKCDEHATCKYEEYQDYCLCNDGWHGNGKTCTRDITDCSRCHPKASCKDKACICNDGYFGDGLECTSENEKMVQQISKIGNALEHIAQRLGNAETK